jgi:hypothetical protein
MNRKNFILLSLITTTAVLLKKYLNIFNSDQPSIVSILYIFPDSKKHEDFIKDRLAWSSQKSINQIRKKYISDKCILQVSETKNEKYFKAEILFKNGMSAKNFLTEMREKKLHDKIKLSDMNYKFEVTVA